MFTEQLVDACVKLAHDPLSNTVQDAVQNAILDGLACMAAGATAVELAALDRFAASLGQGEGVVPGGCREGLTPEAVALIAGARVHTLELDDIDSFSSVHAAGPVLGAALATVEQLRRTGVTVSGEALQRAVAAGYEAACRPGAAVRGRDPYARGFHPTGVYGTFGAAACAATLLGANRASLAAALGIAGSMASGLMAYLQNGAWTKKLHAGWAAYSGFFAARLAVMGFKGPDRIFDGVYNALGAFSPFLDGDRFLEGIGTDPVVTRLSFKAYACCRAIHAPISATLAALSASDISPEAIEAIELRICEEDLLLVAEPAAQKRDPRTPTEAQFSLYWGVAVAAYTGRAGIEQFSASHLGLEAVRRLAARVSYTADPQLTAYRPQRFPAEATVIDRQGRRYSAFVEAPLGDYMNPLSQAALEEKALDLLQLGIGDNAPRALSLIKALGGARDVARVFRQLVPNDAEV